MNKEKLIEILTSNKVKAFAWQTLNGVIVIGISILMEIEAPYIPFIIAALNYVTKELNKKYL